MKRESFKQIYTPYWTWECYKNGMWGKSLNESDDFNKALYFTSNHIEYGEAMNEVMYKWKNTMLNHLTNQSLNRKAFLGHCAVSYKLMIPEYITRKAWKELTENQRIMANYVAQKNIEEWEQKQKLKSIFQHGKKDVINQEYQMKLTLV